MIVFHDNSHIAPMQAICALNNVNTSEKSARFIQKLYSGEEGGVQRFKWVLPLMNTFFYDYYFFSI